MKMTVKIQGMMCGHCVRAVKNAIEALGVKAEVSLENKEAVIEAPAIDEAAVRAAVEEEGYTVTEIK